jgi:hypothetical protein
MKIAYFVFLSLAVFSCSSVPPASKAVSSPDWIQHLGRTSDGSTIMYVGNGEDRTPENALFKSEAMALQDLENECSLVPKNTIVQGDHFQEQVGVIYRAFTQVSVSAADCEAAKKILPPEQLHSMANPQLTSTVESYQKSYDTPEAEEKAPLSDKLLSAGVADTVHFFTLRQQVALGQQNIILSKKSASSPEEIVRAKVRIAEFEKVNPTPQAFSNGRLNWTNHQASAVRETIENRAALNKEYNYQPSPLSTSGKKSPGGRGKGGRRGRSQPPQQTPDSAPSPVPTL